MWENIYRQTDRERETARVSFVVSELERVLPGGQGGQVDRAKMSISPSVCLSDLRVSPLKSLCLSMSLSVRFQK